MNEEKHKPSTLVMQRTVGTENGIFREVVKDPQMEFKVIGVIRRGSLTERGQSKPVYHLYDVRGNLLATESDRIYLEETIAVSRQQEMRRVAVERYKEEDLKKAREPKKTPEKARKATRSTKKKEPEMEL